MSRHIPALVTALMVCASGSVAHAEDYRSNRACRALAATLPAKQEEITRLVDIRDEAAIDVEARGEAWEDAEILRRASRGHASAADTAREAYDAARERLAAHETALQDALTVYNDEVASFNRSCASG